MAKASPDVVIVDAEITQGNFWHTNPQLFALCHILATNQFLKGRKDNYVF